ncbi:GIY-YIG nuclease family protein [Legionella spiritensis]|uniref:Nuclease n=1 Tax=Legionella spiritensis TaxID=452 RepID=A0A0W0YY39_LEGSP|nr:GIY-YIG nuclease family protein [Legionella spiritensis]KTD61567.1 nuclease [Legionella spiritensis]SNV32437.1 nuclease [Legionella spiritensis]
MKKYWVYILRCENDSLYTGYTDDLLIRYQAHKNGTGSKYTRSFKPKFIAQCWEISGEKRLAMQVERQIKKMSREEKESVILCPSILSSNSMVQPGIIPTDN